MGGCSLAQQYPNLYNVSLNKNITVSDALGNDFNNLKFRRTLLNEKKEDWEQILLKLSNFHLSNEKDMLKWKLHNSGIFQSTRCMWLSLILE